MKKLIMLVMLLTISVPVLADDVSPPDWAGVDGSCTVLWDFTAEDPLPTCFVYTPELTDPPDPMFTRDPWDGEWDVATSTYIVYGETRFYAPSPVSDGDNTTFNIQITYDTGDEAWVFAELWTAPDELFGDYIIGTSEDDPPDELIDLGDGRTVGVWTVTFEGDVAEYCVALIGWDAVFHEVILDVVVHDGDPPSSGPGTRCGGAAGPIARNPIPVDEEINAPLDTDLSWDPPQDEIIGITYDVYFGTEPNELKLDWYGNNQIAAGTSETTVPNATLVAALGEPFDYETWYYWRVDTWDPNEGVPQLYEGREWSFRTAPEEVVITGQPQDAVVAEGEDAVFTVIAVNDETYQWYYSATPDGIGTALTGETSDTLVVTNVQLSDEGYYYCEVMNPAMPDATSDRARLLIERMMAHWKLDKNLKDEVSSLNDGTSPMTIRYDDGIDGNAVRIADPDRYIIVDNNIGIFPGATLSAWIKPTDTAGGHVIIETTGEEDGSIHLFQEDDLLIGEVFDDGYAEGTGVVTEAWQHAVLVYNSIDEIIQVYLNGELIAEDDADPDIWAQVGPLTMGAATPVEDPTPVDYFVGLLDDVRIYNYALSCVQVASLYTAEGFMSEEEVCCGDYDTDLSGPEDVPDCRVDIYDLVAFVQNWWLECNIVPDCAFELP
jgi:hypothetical protein